MNPDEVNWLLQTTEDPENAKRFVQAQYQRGRIPYHVMARLARERNWTGWPAVEKPAALISMEVYYDTAKDFSGHERHSMNLQRLESLREPTYLARS